VDEAGREFNSTLTIQTSLFYLQNILKYAKVYLNNNLVEYKTNMSRSKEHIASTTSQSERQDTRDRGRKHIGRRLIGALQPNKYHSMKEKETTPALHEAPSRNSAEQIPQISFNISKFVEVAPEIEQAAKLGASLVWQEEVGTATSINMAFNDRVTQGTHTGEKVQCDALYLEPSDTVHLAVSTIKERYPGAPLDVIACLLSAHETKHRVQFYNGDPPTDSFDTLGDGSYHTDRHEHEAWEAGIRAVGTMYPGIHLGFTIGDHRYESS
jgi:post-segregation antitoxin (ccd killing protein)